MANPTIRAPMNGHGSKLSPTTPTLLAGVRLPYLGLCFIVMLPSALFSHTASSLAAYELFATYGSNLLQAAMLLALALTASRLQQIRQRSYIPSIAAAATAIGVVVTAIAAPTAHLLPLFALGVALALAGSSVLHLSWLSLYAKLGTMLTLGCYAGSLVFSALLQWALSAVAPTVGTAILALCPLLSARAIRAANPGDRDTDEEPTTYEWQFPWRPILLFSVFSYAFKLSLNLLPEEHKAIAIAAGTFAGAAVILALLAARGRKTDLQLLYNASLPCAIAGLLFAIGAPEAYPGAGVTLVVVARELFTTFMVVILCNMCLRNGIDAFWLFGLVFAFSRLASFTANVVTTMASSGLIEASGALSIAAFLVACAFVIFTSDRNAEHLWGIRRRNSGKESPAPLADTDIAMHKLARSCSLTLREEEIALLRLQNLTVAELASRLYITPATVKTHVNRIYRKTGTHSIEELSALLDGHR